MTDWSSVYVSMQCNTTVVTFQSTWYTVCTQVTRMHDFFIFAKTILKTKKKIN